MISGYSRRTSSGQGGMSGSRGVLVPSSRAGAARAAAILLISCHVNPHNNGGVLREESEERSSLASTEPPMASVDDDDQHLMMVQRVEETNNTTQSEPNSPIQLGNTTGVRDKRLRTNIRDSGFNVFIKAASVRLGIQKSHSIFTALLRLSKTLLVRSFALPLFYYFVWFKRCNFPSNKHFLLHIISCWTS